MSNENRLHEEINKALSRLEAQPTPTTHVEWQAIAKRLRTAVLDIRRKPYPISDIIPMLNQAADALDQAQAMLQVYPDQGITAQAGEAK